MTAESTWAGVLVPADWASCTARSIPELEPARHGDVSQARAHSAPALCSRGARAPRSRARRVDNNKHVYLDMFKDRGHSNRDVGGVTDSPHGALERRRSSPPRRADSLCRALNKVRTLPLATTNPLALARPVVTLTRMTECAKTPLDCDEGRRRGCETFCCRLIVRYDPDRRPLSDDGTSEKNCVDKDMVDGLCVHLDRQRFSCEIWEERPTDCRDYDCREDPALEIVQETGWVSLLDLLRRLRTRSRARW